MRFCIVTHVVHSKDDINWFAYGPYVNEMNIWSKYVDQIILVAPRSTYSKTAIHSWYKKEEIEFIELKSFNLLNFRSFLFSILNIPINFFKILWAMYRSDHIHLRCPGNIGLLGCIAQVFFPSKIKTAKYAGNWDPNSKQPLSYRFQKWILNNTFLTKNMQVLVYGSWNGISKNIKPFFTATYKEFEKENIVPKLLSDELKFIFVGTLSSGKQPLYTIQLVAQLCNIGYHAKLDLYGEGQERDKLLNYINDNKLDSIISLKGNQTLEIVKEAYKYSNFLILPSKSEGWPKVVAEAMFWGCLPIATSVSCVPYMLDYGNRGILLQESLDKDIQNIISLINNQNEYQKKVVAAMKWSRLFTIEEFESQIRLLLQYENSSIN